MEGTRHELPVKNPLRDEAAAFRLVLLTLGYFALIVLGAWVSTWLGLAVFVALTATALWRLRGGVKPSPRSQHVERPRISDTRRLLVVANETVGGAELRGVLAARARAGALDVLVVCPALNSPLRTWTSDEDGARDAAQARLDQSLAALREAGVVARGEIGDGDPLQALEDALRTFPADEIVISTHPPGTSNWLERGVVAAAQSTFDVPVTHVVAEGA
jgi:hypothetical protein